MLMRLFQFRIKPVEIDNIKKFFKTSVFPQFEHSKGCLFAALISGEPDANDFISVTFWDSLDNIKNFESSNTLKDLLAAIKPKLAETSEWKIQLSDKMELEYAPVPEEPLIRKYDVKFQDSPDQGISLKSREMFIRIVSFIIQPDKLDEFKRIYFTQVIPELKQSKGCRYIFLTENVNDINEFISVTIWDSKALADMNESSGKFDELVNLFKHTLSHFVLWKMKLEKEFSARIKTSDDIKVDSYNLVTVKTFK